MTVTRLPRDPSASEWRTGFTLPRDMRAKLDLLVASGQEPSIGAVIERALMEMWTNIEAGTFQMRPRRDTRDRTQPTGVRLPAELRRMVDVLIEEGVFHSAAEIVERALEDLLETPRYRTALRSAKRHLDEGFVPDYDRLRQSAKRLQPVEPLPFAPRNTPASARLAASTGDAASAD